MVQNTDKTIEQIIQENPGMPADANTYRYCNNKIPIHKGLKDLNYKPYNYFNSIAINTHNNNYMCIDFDGYSQTDEKTEKQHTATIIKDNFIELLNQVTSKYRMDKTASNKYHVWLKHPNLPGKEFLKLGKFLTSDGTAINNDIVEIFSAFDKHMVHLAGSTITDDGATIGAYENVYAGAAFDELDDVPNVKALLVSAITSAGYYQKIENPLKVRNTIRYYYCDALHDGYIKESHRDNKLYFSYLENEIEVNKHFYIVNKNEFSVDHITSNCIDEFSSIITSIYYYHQTLDDESNAESIATVENQELSKQLIEVYKQHWDNTRGNRHNLMLATSHVLIKYLGFNDSDLDFFFDTLSDAVDNDIDAAHRTAIKEGLEHHAEKEYGIPTIIDILECEQDALNFLAKDNVSIQNELEYLERIKPTLTDEIKADERTFKKIQEFQLNNFYNGIDTYIKIEPTRSVTNLITQILSNSLYNESDNISKLLIALTGVMIGTNRTYIVVSGVSSAGKSALVKTVKKVIPGNYITQLDDLSEKAFERHTESKGKYAYSRMIIDYGDKGNIKGYEKVIDAMAKYQNLITDGKYSYRVTDTQNNNPNGTKDLQVVTDGFAQIITTTKDILAKIDEQLITRSEILYIGNNSKDDISNFNAELGIKNRNKQVDDITKIIQNHMLFNLNKYNDINDIIVEQWRHYITRLLIFNGGVNREIDATMNALKSYSWLEISRIKKVIGNDDRTYYVVSSDIVKEFIELYGVKSNRTNDTDNELIELLKDNYKSIDGDIIYNGYDLNSKEKRDEFNIFTYQDIESLLKKDENIVLYNKINNVSDILRKLEKNNILSRLSDNTSQRNVIYYLNSKSLSYDKELEILSINDDDVEKAIEHLKYHEVIRNDNKDISIFGKFDLKFDDDIDFSFIDQTNNTDAPGGVKNDKDDKDDDGDDTGANKNKQKQTKPLPKQRKAEKNTNNINTIKNSSDAKPGTHQEVKRNKFNKIKVTDDTSDELVNLHCHTDESTGDGATSIEKLIDTAIQHNQKAIALTNHGTLNGLYKFNKLCNQKGIKAILGIEAYISKNRYHLILLAKNYKGYNDLLKLHNKNVEYMKNNGLKRNDKYVNGGIYYSNLEKDKELLKNIICLSGCISGEIPTLLLNGKYEQAKELAITYNSIFNKFYLELQFNGLKEQEKLNELLIELSNETRIPLTVTGDVHYISNKDDWNAIKYAHRKGSKAPASNNSFMIAAPKTLAESTIDIANSIASYNIETSLHIPKPKKEHNQEWLKKYCYDKLKEYDIDDDIHRNRLEKELTVIKDEIADYIILLYEIVESIKSVSGAIGGRGSAVGSLVCYLLGFHEVDPIKYNLLFERFLNVERIQKALTSDTIDTSLLPDIDLNIADDKKDEVFAILEKKYNHIAKVMTYSRLKADNKTIQTIKSLYPAADVIDLKYNLSIHAGGVILSTESFNNYLPITLTKDNEIVTDCDLNEVESRGGIKYDLLGESSSKINDGITLKDDEIESLVEYTVKHPIGISQFTGYSARKYFKNNTIKDFNDLLNATALIRTGSNESWIFQEDMMQEATKYGVTLADADFLRKPRGNEQEKQEKLNKIIQTMINNGCKPADAELFKNYHNNYSFNKSHAVAYTLESLKNAKLKKTNTAKFFELKLNHAKDPITIAELFDDAIKLDVEIIPPDRNYYKLDATADGNKLYIGTKFIKGISSKEPISKGKFNKTYKEYLKKSFTDRLYSIGAYNKKELPVKDIISIGYKTIKDNVIVATISAKGLSNIWFEKSEYYKPNIVFDKGAIISDAFIESYAPV